MLSQKSRPRYYIRDPMDASEIMCTLTPPWEAYLFAALKCLLVAINVLGVCYNVYYLPGPDQWYVRTIFLYEMVVVGSGVCTALVAVPYFVRWRRLQREDDQTDDRGLAFYAGYRWVNRGAFMMAWNATHGLLALYDFVPSVKFLAWQCSAVMLHIRNGNLSLWSGMSGLFTEFATTIFSPPVGVMGFTAKVISLSHMASSPIGEWSVTDVVRLTTFISGLSNITYSSEAMLLSNTVQLITDRTWHMSTWLAVVAFDACDP
jgi:hypothetical protein